MITWWIYYQPIFFIILLAMSPSTWAQVTNMDNSPYNMQNSPYNIDNSPYNMRNSPYNMDNSPYNMRNSPYNMDNSAYNASAKNGVYDNTGNRIGYEVKAPSGVTNYFDNSGNRIGYTPSKR